MADRSVLVLMTLSDGDLERRDAKGQIFRTQLLNLLMPFDLKQPNSEG